MKLDEHFYIPKGDGGVPQIQVCLLLPKPFPSDS